MDVEHNATSACACAVAFAVEGESAGCVGAPARAGGSVGSGRSLPPGSGFDARSKCNKEWCLCLQTRHPDAD